MAPRSDFRSKYVKLAIKILRLIQRLYAPLNFLRTGFYYRSFVVSKFSFGYWWRAASATATSAHFLDTNPSLVLTTSFYPRGYGFAVRCVVRER